MARRCWLREAHSLPQKCPVERIICACTFSLSSYCLTYIVSPASLNAIVRDAVHDEVDLLLTNLVDALIYPGLGLGTVVSRSRSLTDSMILAGARRLASLAPALKDPDDALLPAFEEAPEVNFEVSCAVAEQAIEEGAAGVSWSKEEVRDRVKESIWLPEYGKYAYDEQGEK